MRKLTVFVFAALLTFLLVGNLAAQTQFGTVGGVVSDEKGARVPDAKVTLTNIATNAKMEGQTNSVGLFTIGNVPAGVYDLSVTKEHFRKLVRRTTVEVAQRIDLDLTLQVGAVTEVVTVTGEAALINTATAQLSREISGADLANLPLLTRNPYALVGLAAGAVDTGQVTGDTRGVGIAISGARTSDVNFMLDGGENNDTFVAGVAQVIPLDSIQEFRVQSNANTAEFGRNPIVANVITKSGSNTIHGSAYEYYRGAALTTETYEDKASGTPKANFVRNVFGGSVGGPIIKDKTFFFGSFEALRVRGAANARFFVPTPAFVAASSTLTQNFLSAFSPYAAGSCADAAVTAADIAGGGGIEHSSQTPISNPYGSDAAHSLFDQTATLIPAATDLFCRATLRRAADNGGGTPQNTYLWTARVDHHFSPNTSILMRYAFQQEKDTAGSVSFSPYSGLNTGQDIRNQNMNLTLTHTFSPRLFNETRVVYNRVNQLQPLGTAPSTTPCWFYRNAFGTTTGDEITFPGYVPDVCSFAGIPFGGPQNIYQLAQGWTLSKGKHTWKWGASYLHMRDNRTFGAYENAFERTNTIQRMLNGLVDRVQVAIDPKGKVPGEIYSTAVDGPFVFPRFDRHFHYNELAFYGEDSVKVTPRFTLTLGLRWEYFGVLHSPDGEKLLDANLYLNAVGPVSSDIFQQVRDARFRRTEHFYKSDYHDFGPRIGIAYDIFGNGRTVFRSGYGLYYSRNFGNAVFNSIQNPPNYMTVTLSGTALGPIMPNQFDTLGAIGGASLTLASSSRMLDANMRTAYAAQWNVTLEHDLFGKGLVASLSYIGANGYRLYSLNNLNQVGSCVREPTLSAVCVADAGASGFSSLRDTRLNQTGLTGMNRRSNEGLSRYHGMSLELKTRKIGSTGLGLVGNYTWSHSIDNESSFFADSPFEGNFGFGFRDAYNPGLDRSTSTNDIKSRGTISAIWDIPWGKHHTGLAGQIFGGWTLNTIFVAQSGAAFSIYDNSSDASCNGFDGTNFCYPAVVGSIPSASGTPAGVGFPNSFTLYDVTTALVNQDTFCATLPFGTTVGGCGTILNQLHPELLSQKNLFRTPGYYNMDFSILKDFKLPREGMKLQFRIEAFNLLNHSNMYVVPGSNLITNPFTSASDPAIAAYTGPIAKKGVPPSAANERRNIQLALRLVF